MSKPKYIMGKDFHKHVGKKILMPHPSRPEVFPVELLIEKVDNKRVTLKSVEMGTTQTDNFSHDKNKYLVIE